MQQSVGKSVIRGILTLVLLIVGSGCDSAPGVPDASQSAPEIDHLTFSPQAVLLDNLPPGSIVDGIAHFSIDVAVDVMDADGDLERAFILIQSPIARDEPIAFSQVDLPGNGRIDVELEVDIDAAEIGVYTVRAYASDRAGNLGNQVIGSLLVDASGEPPVIDQVDLPETVTRPAVGQPPVEVKIVAHVTDPDGLANVLRVETVINGVSTLRLCDDGGSSSCNAGFSGSGDAVAGDGLFTLTIVLDASNAPGPNEFVFTAIDRAGLESAPVTRTIVVE